MLEDYTSSASSILQHDPMQLYRAKRDRSHRSVASKYSILGFISSGTYGRVYKAISLEDDGPEDDEDSGSPGSSISGGASGRGTSRGRGGKSGRGTVHAIKKFKPDKEGDVVAYTGISQSAIREIGLNREIHHENIVALKEVILEDKSIYMVFEYAEHDFLQVIHHHSQTLRATISPSVLKSLVYQLINGLIYLHSSHILHRDLKPANILITSSGLVKIGDLGLARLIYEPLQPLFAGDKVVVTIWYRAPELLLGAKHYTKAIDCWAVGCVMAELISLRPIFKGEEAKLDGKKNVPFQKDQLLKIFEVLGKPNEKDWPSLVEMPEYTNMKRLDYGDSRLESWLLARSNDRTALDLLEKFFKYDPEQRLTAKEALRHRWFQEEPRPTWNAFETAAPHQIPPNRRITQDEAPSMVPLPQNSHPHGAGHGMLGGPPFGQT
ncbi:hypothetical protein CVT26_011711, partial [Gymnopilus dilepis]